MEKDPKPVPMEALKNIAKRADEELTDEQKRVAAAYLQGMVAMSQMNQQSA